MFVIQDPTEAQGARLLESLADAFHDAKRIAGAFAYVSSRGVSLLANNDAFRAAAAMHTVDLVVGLDAVTNEEALNSLEAVSNEFQNVTIRAFVNPEPGRTFHPKFCWTEKRGGTGQLVVGSGNLTERGLLGNWEAYTSQPLDHIGLVAVTSAWDTWVARQRSHLLPLDDEEVRRRAKANRIMAIEGDLPTLVVPPSAEEPEPLAITNSAEVLVAEIPSGNTRWNQANFHKKDYFDYFGVQPGKRSLYVFRQVKADGTTGGSEQGRPPVTVRSQNYRFELGAAAGLVYPTDGPPIGVFIRMAPYTFYYRLIMPDDPQFRTVQDILQRHAGSPVIAYRRDGKTAFRMRSVRMAAADLRSAWPAAPFWSLPATP
jgi:hypothetical protein